MRMKMKNNDKKNEVYGDKNKNQSISKMIHPISGWLYNPEQ